MSDPVHGGEAPAGSFSTNMSELFDTDVNVTDDMLRAVLDRRVAPHLHFSGLQRVDRRVLRHEMDGIMAATTGKELFGAVERAHFRWSSIGVFNDIKISYEPIADAGPEDVCVHIHVDEKKASKQVGVVTTDASVPEVSASLNNIFSGRYSIHGRYVPPAARTHAFSLSVLSNVPLFGRTAEYYAGVRRDDRPLHLAESERVTEAKAVFSDVENDRRTQWSVGAQQRETACRDRLSLPLALSQEIGADARVFASHQWFRNTETFHTHPFLYGLYPLPVQGSSLHLQNELAYNVSSALPTWRVEGQWSKFFSLNPFMVLTWSGRMGAVASPTGHVPVNDRLYLGWRHVRGYRNIGPSTADPAVTGGQPVPRFAATGGNVLWASSLSLSFPIPFLPTNGLLAGHVFADAGSCAYWPSVSGLGQRAYDLVRDASCSVGAGLILTQIPFFGALPNGRFEFNCSVPIAYNLSTGDVSFDGPRRGLFDRWRFGLSWSTTASD